MIWKDFLNSLWHDWRGSGASEDRLESPSWRSHFLSSYGYSDDLTASSIANDPAMDLQATDNTTASNPTVNKQATDIVMASNPTVNELIELKHLRDGLRQLTHRINESVRGTPPVALVQDDFTLLNKYLADSPFTRSIVWEAGALQMLESSQAAGWGNVMARITAAYAATLAHGELERFRICDNPDCKWMYYDGTRNRSKRYCDDKCCGNLMKVRRFRERAKDKFENSSKN
ncbi:Putative stress-induced transcription regulator [Paenibacillaceae bacterium GAS479]|nr:Putative stress-induced transcription regulator [Paenibacillaceae bacterium GAS479]